MSNSEDLRKTILEWQEKVGIKFDIDEDFEDEVDDTDEFN